jgi:hypothetical protein
MDFGVNRQTLPEQMKFVRFRLADRRNRAFPQEMN